MLADIALLVSVSLEDKTEKRYDFFALEGPGFESHTRILSVSLSVSLSVCLSLSLSLSLSSVNFLNCFYYYCETTDTADENLDLWLYYLW